ncbi:MAG: glutamate synthase subunit beta [Lentisphaeria bacterium]|nr:glutamate synthase subunit beta [Lentisphaeria bacterium]NQZ68062.1 glutamate synthase subunit beta [Lentisphaeria bacterium]
MGQIDGFMKYERELPKKKPIEERIQNYDEMYEDFPDEKLQEQASRCMDCGIPFCHIGCPLGNIIPDWNDLVYRGDWQEAVKRLLSTNNFPEFTGRICPAPCEEACVLGINEPAVTIEEVEKTIIEHAFAEGWIKAEPPETRTGKTIAVIGSGPAGLATAMQLNRAGHSVTVYERASRIGGLVRYGIPDFKLAKSVVQRRVDLMTEEGISFITNAHVGEDPKYDIKKIKEENDATILTGGATKARGLPIPGSDLNGVYAAMDFLSQNNMRVAGDDVDGDHASYVRHDGRPHEEVIHAKGKNVIVIGGGDTGSDCIGTSVRHGARSVNNFELFPKPPVDRPDGQPWPYWPMKLRKSTSHNEMGRYREFAISTKEFRGDENGNLKELLTVEIEFVPDPDGGRPNMVELEGTEKAWPVEMVLLAMGFLGPETGGMIEELGLELDARGNVHCDSDYQSCNVPGVFAAGDMRRGQSLVVWAISEGRECARNVDQFLMGHSELPTKDERYDLPRV